MMSEKIIAQLTYKEKKACEMLVNELRAAKRKHPNYPKDPIHQVAIIAEESGEATRASLQHCYEGGTLKDIDNEVIETGAMALRYLIENEVES